MKPTRSAKRTETRRRSAAGAAARRSRGRCARGQRRTALAAELHAGRVRSTAGGARVRERAPALAAELAACLVRGAAGRSTRRVGHASNSSVGSGRPLNRVRLRSARGVRSSRDRSAELSPTRAWWLRVPAVLLSPGSVFFALREDDEDDVAARSEPLLLVIWLAGMAAVLATPTAADILDDPEYDTALLAIWAFIAGGLYGVRRLLRRRLRAATSASGSSGASATSAARGRPSASRSCRSRCRSSSSCRCGSRSTAATRSAAAAPTRARASASCSRSSSRSPSGRSCCSSSASVSCTAGAGRARSPPSLRRVALLAAMLGVFVMI